MEGVFGAFRQSALSSTTSCIDSKVYQEESLRLGRYVAKLQLVMHEIELQLHTHESLRGSQAVFLAAEAACGASKQAEQLLAQCCKTGAAEIWPLEDAVEFQSVALELLNAMSGLAALEVDLPADIQEDAVHFSRQLKGLQFTMAELEETEETELTGMQESYRERRSAGEETRGVEQAPLPAPAPAGSADAGGHTALGQLGAQPGAPEPAGKAGEEFVEGGEGGIPPPDESLTEELDRAGIAYVSLDDSSTTIMPPGVPVKGAAPPERQRLPTDPFLMQPGEEGALAGADVAARRGADQKGRLGAGGAGGAAGSAKKGRGDD